MLATEEAALDIARQVMETGGNPWEWADLEWIAGPLKLRCEGMGVWHVYNTSERSAGGWLAGANMGNDEQRKVGLWILRTAAGLSADATRAFHDITRAITADFHPQQMRQSV